MGFIVPDFLPRPAGLSWAKRGKMNQFWESTPLHCWQPTSGQTRSMNLFNLKPQYIGAYEGNPFLIFMESFLTVFELAYTPGSTNIAGWKIH